MSTFYHQSYYYPEQPQVLIAPNTYENAHYDGRQKTPASLINHPSLSPGPGPLSTPQSRNTSQPPEQPPSQNWEDGFASLSNSPTSVGTPENDDFDQEMRDAPESMRNFYQNQHGDIVTTQVSQGEVEAIPMDLSSFYFSNQVLQEHLDATISAMPQQYNAQFNVQPSQAMQTVLQEPYNQLYSQAYTSQPSRHDPWTGQGPPRNPTVPRSGVAVFDPASDNAMDLSAFVNFDVNNWTNNNTDPNYLISPNAPAAPPMDNPFFFPQTQHHQHHQHHHNSQDHSPIEMKVTLDPAHNNGPFVNYTQNSSFFTDSYLQESQSIPSPGVNSTSAQFGASPYQGPVSPMVSAPSPGGSDGIFSAHTSELGGSIMLEAYPTIEKPEFNPAMPISPVHAPDPSPTRIVPDVIFDHEPEPETEPELPRQDSSRGVAGRPGGRALGTHLNPNVAKAAHDMRRIVACWHCVLQRDKCGPGDICDRCMKRAARPNADCGLGCSRVKLVELTEYFLPTLVTQMHEDAQLTHFVSQHIHRWLNVEITVYMTCGQATMPRLPVKVYEFLPKTNELLRQFQYRTDPITHKRERVEKQSPAVGMVHINHNEEKRYDKYINDIVDNHLDAFGELCWMDDDNDFQQKLFRLMTRVKPKTGEEGLLREVFRLIVATFIMSHTLTIADETKASTLSRLHSFNGQVSNFTSPRMTNRQLKYFFARIQRTILTNVLNKLQQIFKSSKGCDKWIAAFCAVVGLGMAFEDQQMTVHLVMETRAVSEGKDTRDYQTRADYACREIDSRMSFIAQIFRWKYNRKCNPLKDADHDWDREAGFGDANNVGFVRQVAALVKENIDFLSQRQNISISSANQTKYISRLVGQFLLSFWLPS